MAGEDVLERIASALERMAPPPMKTSLEGATQFIWRPHARRLEPSPQNVAPPLSLLVGVEDQRDALLANTQALAAGRPANHALLWGARGTGKSALVKAVCAATPEVALVDLPIGALADAPLLIEALTLAGRPAVLFLDDLALERGEAALRALKPALDGGLGAAGQGVAVYATANRRHIVGAAQGDARADPQSADAEQERLSLSDRFGLWLGFHPTDQNQYLAIIEAYAAHFALPDDPGALKAEALAFAMARGARSGRTAWQFITAKRASAP
jgi:predicted AAA+ superfamily ATPase